MGRLQTPFVPSYPRMGQRDRFQAQGTKHVPSQSQTGQRDQSMGRGRGQGSQVNTSGTQGRVYAIVPQTEPVEQSVIHGMFLLSRLWIKILFDSGVSHPFIAASCVEELGLEVETLEKPLYVSSLLGTRVSVQRICRSCELEISGILLTVDLRVMDMTEFDVFLGMDWLTAHWVVIDCDRRRVTAYTRDGVCVVFQGDKHYDAPTRHPMLGKGVTNLRTINLLTYIILNNYLENINLQKYFIYIHHSGIYSVLYIYYESHLLVLLGSHCHQNLTFTLTNSIKTYL